MVFYAQSTSGVISGRSYQENFHTFLSLHVPPNTNVKDAANAIRSHILDLETSASDAFKIITGEFNYCSLKAFGQFYTNVKDAYTLLDQFYTNVKDAYTLLDQFYTNVKDAYTILDQIYTNVKDAYTQRHVSPSSWTI